MAATTNPMAARRPRAAWADYMYWAICAGLFFMPFYRFERYSSLGWVVENHLLWLLALPMALAATAKATTRRSTQLVWVDYLVTAYVAYLGAHMLLHAGSAAGLAKFHQMVALAVVYLATRLWAGQPTQVQARRHGAALLLAFFASAIAHGALALAQLKGFAPSLDPNFKASGGFALASHLAFYMGLALPLAVGAYTLYQGKGWWPAMVRYAAMGAVICATFLLPIIKNRASWLMALSGLALILGYRLYSQHRQAMGRLLSKKWLVAGLLTGGLCLAVAGGWWLYQFKAGSSQGRVLAWKVLASQASANPIFGQGYNQVEHQYGAWLIGWHEQGLGSAQERMLADQVRVAYNELLEVFVETGLVGLVLFGAILAALFAGLRRVAHRHESLLWYAAVLALVVCGMVSYPFAVPVAKAAFFVFLALAVSHTPQPYRPATAPRKPWPLALAAFGTGYALLVAWWAVPVVVARDNIQFGRELYAVGDYQDAAPYYADWHAPLAGYFFIQQEYAQTLYHLKRYRESLDVAADIERQSPSTPVYLLMGNAYKAMGEVGQAEWAYTKAHHIAPSRFYPLYLIAKLHHEAGNIEKSRAMAARILGKVVKVDSPAIREMKNEMEALLETTAHRAPDSGGVPQATQAAGTHAGPAR